MATSGSFMGNRTVTNGPQLYLTWSRIETDIANNRSKLRLSAKVYSQYSIAFNASKSGVLEGSSFTYSGGMNSSGYRTVKTRDIWVAHDSDGSKSITLNAELNLNISWSTGYVSKISVSGTAYIDTIPRASDLTSASISSLTNGSSSTLSIGRSVKHSGFYHLVSIYDGTTWIWDSDYFSGYPSTSYTLSSGYVEKMLNRMPTVENQTYRVRLRTYTSSGGSGYIGESSRNTTVSVNSSVMPSASSLSKSQTGNGVSSHYLQSISRINVNFSASAGYGASLTETKIFVRKDSDHKDSQIISGTSGTTKNTLSEYGIYEVIGVATDSRGRTSSVRTTFTSTIYRPPTMSIFKVSRQTATPTIVDIERAGYHTALSPLDSVVGENILSVNIQSRVDGGTWQTEYTTSVTSSNFGAYMTLGGIDETKSYEFRITLTDEFNNHVTAYDTVSTQKVLMDIHKDLGVGIGKIHEQGALDVGGISYFNGDVITSGRTRLFGETRFDGGIESIDIASNSNLNDLTNVGYYYCSKNAVVSTLSNCPTGFAFSLHVEKHAGVKQTLSEYMNSTMITTYVRNEYSGIWGAWYRLPSTMSGSNANGEWIRFDDGTQMCWTRSFDSTGGLLNQVGNMFRSSSAIYTFPVSFLNNVVVTAHSDSWETWCTTFDIIQTSVRVIEWSPVSGKQSSRSHIFAIGRWK